MIDVYTQWCGPCKMLDKNTFHHAEVVKYVNANYYAVKFDAESPDPVTYKDKTYTNPDYDPARRQKWGTPTHPRLWRECLPHHRVLG